MGLIIVDKYLHEHRPSDVAMYIVALWFILQYDKDGHGYKTVTHSKSHVTHFMYKTWLTTFILGAKSVKISTMLWLLMISLNLFTMSVNEVGTA